MDRVVKKRIVKRYQVTWLGFVLAFCLSLGFAQDLTLAAHYTAEQAAALEPCIAAYAQETGVNVAYQQISYGDYLQTILTARIGGQAPDIYHIYSIWAPQLVDNGVLDAPPDNTLSWIKDSYISNTVDAVTINGQVWGIPTEVSNYMLVYNKQLLAEAGFDAPPSTWTELLDMAAAITKRNDQGNITTAGYAYGSSTATVVHPFFTMLYSAGINPFKDDFSGTNLTSPEAIAVLEQQIELFKQGITDRSIEVWDFPSGSIAMMFMASWFEADLRAAFVDNFDDVVGVAPIPMGDDWRSLQYAFFYGVDANSPNKEAAWDFLEWLNTAQSEGQTSCMGTMLMDLGALTANKADIAAAQDNLGDSFTAPYVAALERSITEPNVIQASEIEGILKTYIERAWAGELTAEEALTQADKEITTILKEFY
ncbi:MAG: extracellular solute-binding protein [Trueperaceae bacterium]|nr:extracellular solute-binding protein [Trueperaceae bacterium]